MFDNCNDRTHEVVNRVLDIYGVRNENIWAQDTHYINVNKARNSIKNLIQGKYVWYICDDDEIIGGTYALFNLINFLNAHNDQNIIKLNFETVGQEWYTTEELKNTYSFIWQYIFKKELIEQFEFDEGNDLSTDSKNIQELFMINDPNNLNNNLIIYEKPIYFYNFCREGSKMYRLAKQNNYV